MLIHTCWISIIILSSVASVFPDDNSCTTDNGPGICEELINCPSILNEIRNAGKPMTTALKTKLQRLLCGFNLNQPKVCCTKGINNNTTFNKEASEIVTRDSLLVTTETTESTPYVRMKYGPFPNRSICGQIYDNDKIFGGITAGIDEFPWLTLIKIASTKRKFQCAGSLITDRDVLTVAHCVQGQLESINVRLGEWNTEMENDCYNNICSDKPIDVAVEKYLAHPKFSKVDPTKYDIALLRLKERVAFSDFIQPVCLPTTEHIAAQDYLREAAYTATGWGLTESGDHSPVKRKVQLKAVSLDICQPATRFPDSSLPYIICAGGRKGEDTCRGDSGGPLLRPVSENYEMNWYLYGITSIGSNLCGSEGIPSLYTRVTAHMDWIRQTIEDFDRKEKKYK